MIEVDNIYAVERYLPGEAVFVISDDGLYMDTYYQHPTKGDAKSRVGWESLELAQENYAKCRAAFLKQVPRVIEKLDGLSGGTTDRIDRSKLYSKVIAGHKVYLYINTGPPTWWKPSVRIKKNEVGIGWLRACAQVSWKRVDG